MVVFSLVLDLDPDLEPRLVSVSFLFSTSGLSPAFRFPSPSVYSPARLGSFFPCALLFTASSSSCTMAAVIVFFGLFFFGLCSFFLPVSLPGLLFFLSLFLLVVATPDCPSLVLVVGAACPVIPSS